MWAHVQEWGMHHRHGVTIPPLAATSPTAAPDPVVPHVRRGPPGPAPPAPPAGRCGRAPRRRSHWPPPAPPDPPGHEPGALEGGLRIMRFTEESVNPRAPSPAPLEPARTGGAVIPSPHSQGAAPRCPPSTPPRPPAAGYPSADSALPRPPRLDDGLVEGHQRLPISNGTPAVTPGSFLQRSSGTWDTQVATAHSLDAHFTWLIIRPLLESGIPPNPYRENWTIIIPPTPMSTPGSRLLHPNRETNAGPPPVRQEFPQASDSWRTGTPPSTFLAPPTTLKWERNNSVANGVKGESWCCFRRTSTYHPGFAGVGPEMSHIRAPSSTIRGEPSRFPPDQKRNAPHDRCESFRPSAPPAMEHRRSGPDPLVVERTAPTAPHAVVMIAAQGLCGGWRPPPGRRPMVIDREHPPGSPPFPGCLMLPRDRRFIEVVAADEGSPPAPLHNP